MSWNSSPPTVRWMSWSGRWRGGWRVRLSRWKETGRSACGGRRRFPRMGSAGILPAGEGLQPSRTFQDVTGKSSAPIIARAAESPSPQDAATSVPEARATRTSAAPAHQIGMSSARLDTDDRVRRLPSPVWYRAAFPRHSASPSAGSASGSSQ